METVKGWQRGSRVSRRSSGIIGDCMTDVNNITIDIIMGTAQVKAKTKNTKSLIQPPKVSVTITLNCTQPIPVQLLQLTNWSLQQIKTVYQTYQRIAESPMLDAFLFKKIMPFSKRNSELVFSLLGRGDKFVSVFEVVGVIVMAAFQTYRKKFQFLCLIFDFEHKGYVNGKQFLLIFYSLLYGYCRLTQHNPPKFQTVQRYAQASFFQGEDDYQSKPVNLRKFIEQYDGNPNISAIFNRFEHFQFKEIKEDPLIYSLGEFRRIGDHDVEKYYRILYKIYAKGDYEEIYLIQENRQLRRQNRRDSCYRELVEEKMSKFESPLKTKRSQSLAKLNTFTLQSQHLLKPSKIDSIKQQFRIKRISSTIKPTPAQKRKLIFLNGHTHSKNQIFETINYFKIFAQSDDKISIKEFFKKFDNKAYMKKQLSSIFKYLDYDRNGEITLQAFFKSFYPGIKQDDLKLLAKWYAEYQEIYEADSLARNQVKVAVMSDARALPYDTYERMREIFRAMDIGNKGFLVFEDMRKSYRQGFTADELENLLVQYGDGEKIHLNGLCKMLLPQGWTIEGVDLDAPPQQK